MISTNNNFGNNINQQQEKTNWKLGRMFGKSTVDSSKSAVLEVGFYKSKYSMFGTLSIRNEMGKDSNGRVQFETGLNKENPSCLLNPENTASALLLCDTVMKDPSKIANLRYVLDSGRSKLEITGSDTSTTFTVTNEIGSKSIKFDATPAGFANIHGCFAAIRELLKIVQKKQLTAKLDPDEFGANESSEESPF